MLAYHEPNDDQASCRSRRETSSRSCPTRNHYLRTDPRSDRDPPCTSPQAWRRCCRQERTFGHLRAHRRNPCQRGHNIALIVDAGPLYAYVDADDQHHQASLDLLLEYPEPLLVPTLVITEVVYLIATRLGSEAEVRFLGDLASGDLGVEPVAASDWLRIAELVHQYQDLPLGAVDASVVAAAERLQERSIATLDRRHFSVVRPNHVDAFTLLP